MLLCGEMLKRAEALGRQAVIERWETKGVRQVREGNHSYHYHYRNHLHCRRQSIHDPGVVVVAVVRVDGVASLFVVETQGRKGRAS